MYQLHLSESLIMAQDYDIVREITVVGLRVYEPKAQTPGIQC